MKAVYRGGGKARAELAAKRRSARHFEASDLILEWVPEARKNAYLKALNGEASPAGAIAAKCHECCGFEDSVERIRDCKCQLCPLWSYRPFRKEEV